MVVADVYPRLPRMRAVHGFPEQLIFSTPLTIAALLAYGPAAVVLFLLSGVLVGFGGRWWRTAQVTVLWGLQGAAAATVVALGGPDRISGAVAEHADPAGSWEPAGADLMVLVTVAMVVVIEALNIVLIGLRQLTLRVESWDDYRRSWWRGRLSALIGLAAPIGAVTAVTGPAMAPLLLVVTVGSFEGIRAMYVGTVLAAKDPLTGVANRAALMARLQRQLEVLGTDRGGGRIAVLLVDLDDFKAINDRYGHVAGDKVLTQVARRLATVTRSDEDLVARFGGDEFAVLLGGDVSINDVNRIAERIRMRVALPVTIGTELLTVGASVGWADTATPTTTAIELFQMADAELYRIKDSRGRPAGARARTAGPQPVGGRPPGRRGPVGPFPAGPTWTMTPGSVSVAGPDRRRRAHRAEDAVGPRVVLPAGADAPPADRPSPARRPDPAAGSPGGGALDGVTAGGPILPPQPGSRD
ncbi:GGDEF domain-containing protein [Nakamurella sp. YIM 132084]|uniref:GGDEF domain-containing protein n=2 Tax=Nakamurella leprariae TaxID=2803911 RepID=A0A938YGC7_9ACTN|nr:GGDEF domain-containing protein [Nakamurella leprariae]